MSPLCVPTEPALTSNILIPMVKTLKYSVPAENSHCTSLTFSKQPSESFRPLAALTSLPGLSPTPTQSLTSSPGSNHERSDVWTSLGIQGPVSALLVTMDVHHWLVPKPNQNPNLFSVTALPVLISLRIFYTALQLSSQLSSHRSRVKVL